jgi:hypothetical protein
MENCSTPNSILVIGRTSMLSPARSKNSSRRSGFSSSAIQRWALEVKCQSGSDLSGLRLVPVRLGLFAFRRVKGAWWPSRSSKPSSVRKDRGRFDSYPLRLCILDFRLPIFDLNDRTGASFQSQNSKSKGGTTCRASKSENSLRFHPAPGEQPS